MLSVGGPSAEGAVNLNTLLDRMAAMETKLESLRAERVLSQRFRISADTAITQLHAEVQHYKALNGRIMDVVVAVGADLAALQATAAEHHAVLAFAGGRAPAHAPPAPASPTHAGPPAAATAPAGPAAVVGCTAPRPRPSRSDPYWVHDALTWPRLPEGVATEAEMRACLLEALTAAAGEAAAATALEGTRIVLFGRLRGPTGAEVHGLTPEALSTIFRANRELRARSLLPLDCLTALGHRARQERQTLWAQVERAGQAPDWCRWHRGVEMEVWDPERG
ncbi:hypothetical protein GPECTOR_101g31 [Gonium pectorale]|uniref:Uncharacterized protein n=1 Tax=Gonium pectorale TaxID=33097 RepID=A0A150G1G4_GONPE|nr:hypothetical protein GPECTOR_101g31 [Gonium pectorale]|eukprot:KXZ43130.1 hypothetical protein GPECTOR_101g31 [Gonium pectorale]